MREQIQMKIFVSLPSRSWGAREKMAGREAAAILAFFGVDPKKVPFF